ncbi:MAG: NADH-quinone oxidoreductase subunit NuoF [Firmicutes bacterium]|jgi:NADP-reducing hydrogenase subunit HndC|nr:NADH-quinone oxidoreductase subunit NuoF [Bacillota bacterium]
MVSLLEELVEERVYESTVHRLLLCGGAPCVSTGCREVKAAVIEELSSLAPDSPIKITEVGCIGNCSLGPSIIVLPEGIVYHKLTPEDARRVVREHLIKGEVAEDLLYRDPDSDKIRRRREDMPFYRGQTPLVLRNCGIIKPDIVAYMKYRGYAALARALTEMTPEEVIDTIKRSGLRGRGGAGFPTGLKWELARATHGQEKYIICNADEGDPGAFMDRSILEGDPHSVIEGMIIAGYAIGASSGYIYVRAEYPLAMQRCEEAVAQARGELFLGENILEHGFSFDIEIRVGAGAFVCGEETALISSLEGARGDPNPRPPFPVQKGLWGHSTTINNVETLANIPLIVLHGAERFREIGTEDSPGTKVFALAGKIKNPGLIEVPMGTTLRTIIYEIGGGIPDKKEFKAAQIGGPSGGCLTQRHLDMPLDYDSLREAGSMIGSGGLIIMDEDTCMVDIARYYLDFMKDESCGKCTPCRIGTRRMLEILHRISRGEGEENDLDRLKQLSTLMINTSLCGLGRSAPNPVLSTINLFYDEYMAHIRDHRCPAGVCPNLTRPEILSEKCKACGICAKVCPVGAITGERKKGYRIDPRKCINCLECVAECPFEAIVEGKRK